MLFNSSVFLFLFLPVCYLVFWALRRPNARYAWLALTGYVFYGYWKPSFCLLMLFSTLVAYGAGMMLRGERPPAVRKFFLIAPISVDLALLAWFKYTDFTIATINALALPQEHQLPLLNIILPVGISFYTFHTITYIVDGYRRDIEPTRNFLEFATYVSLFSQLVAGPIIRFRELRDDLEGIAAKSWRDGLSRGCSFFAIGMIQKVLIADAIASHIDPQLAVTERLSTASAWLCAIGYSYQLLLDFAGYSNMAIGLGLLFGMHIPQNFDQPYQALNPSDFWRRWHMSLSRVLRDYLYIPLGGNREGKADRNLMITMLLGGLWHGPSWTFVTWGGYHGALLVLHRHIRERWDRLPLLLQGALTFLLVILGWVLFRAQSFAAAAQMYQRMFVPTSGLAMPALSGLLVSIGIAAAITHLPPSLYRMSHQWRPWQSAGIALLFALAVLRVVSGGNSPFLYFQF